MVIAETLFILLKMLYNMFDKLFYIEGTFRACYYVTMGLVSSLDFLAIRYIPL